MTLSTAPSDKLGPYVGIALAGHVAVVLAVILGEALLPEAPKAPLIDPADAIEVFAAMPKSTSLPQRATRTAAPQAPSSPDAPAEVVPPKQSEMAYASDKPDPKAAGTDDKNRKITEDAKMRSLLDDLDADVGDRDRDASSPDGVAGARGTRNSGKGDPEMARYVDTLSRLFLEHFQPLPTLKGQGYKTTVAVTIDGDGRILTRRVSTKSGNAYWDRAALSAAEAVASVPLPPDKYRALATEEGLAIEFKDP